MDNVINKTKELIEVIESSELIKNLDYYKNKIIFNNDIMSLIDKYNNSNDEHEKLFIKEKIYKYDDYKSYMKYYNELFYYVLKINGMFRRYTSDGGCDSESH